MADFCKQCSIELFGEDCGDLKGISSRSLTEDEIKNGIGWTALCEGCGSTVVNDDGECIFPHCLKKHEKE